MRIRWIVLLLLFGAVCVLMGSASAWHEDWDYRIEMSVNSNWVNSDQTDFPVGIFYKNINLSENCQSDFDDIVFTNETDVKLSHEIEYYNNSDGRLVAWVKMNISSTSDTIFYMYYGNDSCADQRNSEDVWSNDYRAVYHFNETSGQILDSTANSFDSTALSVGDTENYGIWGNYYRFTASADYISLPIKIYTDMNLDGTGDDGLEYCTSSICAYSTEQGDRSQCVIMLEQNDHWEYGAYGDNLNWRYRPAKAGEDELGTWSLTGLDWAELDWIFMASTYGYDITSYFYMGEFFTTTGSFSPDIHLQDSDSSTAPTDLFLGHSNDASGNGFEGYMDEYRVSGVSRSADWMNAEYNSLYKPDFLNYLGVEPFPVPCEGGDCDCNSTNVTFYKSIGIGCNCTNETSYDPDSGWSIWLNCTNGCCPCIGSVYPYGDIFLFDDYISVEITSCQGNIMNLSIYENSTGSWLLVNESTGLSNGTCYIYNTSWIDNGTYYLNITVDDGNCIVQKIISFNLDYTIEVDMTLDISDVSFGIEQFSVIIGLLLFVFWMWLGYTSEKRSGGAFMVFAGFTMFYIEVLLIPYVSAVFVIPFISPLAIFIILLGFKKFLYSDSDENKKIRD